MHTRTHGKKQWPHKSLGQTYQLVLERLLWRWGAAMAHYRDKDDGSSSSVEYSLVWALLEVTVFSIRPGQTQQPVGSCAGKPQAKQPTGQENSTIHQQTGCLKSSWAQSCPLNTPLDMALPTRGTRPSSTHQWAGTSPSQQEDSTSLLNSLTHQGAESRSKKNYNPAPCGMETTITESETKGNSRGICPRWRNKIKPLKNN